MLCIAEKKIRTPEQIRDIPAPDATPTWKPVEHGRIMEAVVTHAKTLGLEPREQKWGVEDGILYHKDGNKIIGREIIPSGRLFGFLSFNPGEGWPSDMGLSIAVRHANDKSTPLSIAYGATVFLCSNGVMTGEHVIRRKHTSHINVEALVEEAFQRIATEQRKTLEARTRLDRLPMTSDSAALAVVKCAKAGAIPSSRILPALAEFENPKQAEWADYPRSGWRLYNAVNVQVKKANEMNQVKALGALSSVLFGLVGLG